MPRSVIGHKRPVPIKYSFGMRDLQPLTTPNFPLVGTMYEGGRSSNIAKEMRNCKLEILGFCGTRCIEAEQIRLATSEIII